MKTETVAIDSISLDPANVRRHPDRNIQTIVASLKRFGQQKPIVVTKEGIVIAGNGTLQAARHLGWKQIEIVRTGLTGSDATAYAIADNRTAELAEWDDDALAQTLAALQIEDEALALDTGFDAKDIDALLSPDEVTEDEVPEPPADPITKPGDLWLLGEHRLLCGDSTKAEDVERLMAGAKAGMMVTDPPYGVNYDPSWRVTETEKQGWSSDGYSLGKVENDSVADWSAAWSLFAGDIAYVWHASLLIPLVWKSLCDSGLEVRSLIVWAKQLPNFSRGHYHWQHEPCVYMVRKGSTASWVGDRKQTTVWSIQNHAGYAQKDDGKTIHATQKPIECMARPMRNHEAELIYDPFLGSGTTLIAAEQLDRKCYGMEISPAYCDVIVKRWETLTGKKATLEAR